MRTSRRNPLPTPPRRSLERPTQEPGEAHFFDEVGDRILHSHHELAPRRLVWATACMVEFVLNEVERAGLLGDDRPLQEVLAAKVFAQEGSKVRRRFDPHLLRVLANQFGSAAGYTKTTSGMAKPRPHPCRGQLEATEAASYVLEVVQYAKCKPAPKVSMVTSMVSAANRSSAALVQLKWTREQADGMLSQILYAALEAP